MLSEGVEGVIGVLRSVLVACRAAPYCRLLLRCTQGRAGSTAAAFQARQRCTLGLTAQQLRMAPRPLIPALLEPRLTDLLQRGAQHNQAQQNGRTSSMEHAIHWARSTLKLTGRRSETGDMRLALVVDSDWTCASTDWVFIRRRPHASSWDLSVTWTVTGLVHNRQRMADGSVARNVESSEDAPSAGMQREPSPNNTGGPASQFDSREDERRALSNIGFEAGPRPILDGEELG